MMRSLCHFSDLKSMSSGALASDSMSILLKRAGKSSAAKEKVSDKVCEAYKYGTDFNQRPGSIFHGILYHLLSSTYFIA